MYVKARSHWPTDTKRMQKGHSGRAKFRGWLHPFSSAPEIDKIGENLRKQNIVHGGKFIRSKLFFCSSKLFARMKSQWTDARWIERMQYVCNEYTTDAQRFSTDGKIFFYVLHPLCIRNGSGTRPLHKKVHWFSSVLKGLFSSGVEGDSV